MIPQRSSHRDVHQHLTFPNNADLTKLASTFSNLSSSRNKADYDLAPHNIFATSNPAVDAVRETRSVLALLDAIDADPARRAQAIADIRSAFP